MPSIRTYFHLAAVLLLAGLSACCKPDRPEEQDDSYNRVVLFLVEGRNSLLWNVQKNVETLSSSYIPPDDRDALLVLSNVPPLTGSRSDPYSPVLFRIRPGKGGEPVRDTLLTLTLREPIAKGETLSSVLSWVGEHFPSEHYGLVMGSHSSGWLPVGYKWPQNVVTWNADKNRPKRSFGKEEIGGKTYSLSIPELAGAIPMHLDFLYFDSCLMGCVEVAYELKDVVDYIAFSPTEVLSDGLDYTTVSERLFGSETPELERLCSDYFALYDGKSGTYRSATISLVDCRRISALAELCKTLFGTYRDSILQLDPEAVQRLYGDTPYLFFDMEDILVKAGISEGERLALRQALDDCVVYKAATPSYSAGTAPGPITSYCGMSMYLPSVMNRYSQWDFTELNDYYRKEVAWNAATGLLE